MQFIGTSQQIDIAGEKIHHLLVICDRIWEDLPLMHKDKYLEIRNSIIQWIYTSRMHGAAYTQFWYGYQRYFSYELFNE